MDSIECESYMYDNKLKSVAIKILINTYNKQ